MSASHRVVLPLARIQAVIGRAFAVRSDAEQRTERIERVKAAVKSERELVQVGLQMLGADRAVMRASKPSLQVRKNEMNNHRIGMDISKVLVL